MMFTTKFYKKYYPVGKYTLMAPKDVRTMKKFLLEYPRELDISIHSIERRNYTWGLMYKKINEDENVMLKLKSHMSENGFHEMSSDELELCNFILNWNTLLRFGIPITASEMFAWDNGLRDEYSLKRLCGFTYDALDFTRKCGDSCCEFGRLLNIVNRRISMYSAAPVVSDIFSRSLLYCCITQLDKYMACHKVGDKIYVYFNSIWEEEQKVVRNIKRLEENRKEIIPASSIEDIEEKLGIKYNEEQREVFKAITTTGVKILTGPPGSGKTAVIKGLMEYYGEACHLSATTGMAAQVMQEACGQTAETVHRMLDITPYDERLRGRSLNEPVPENFVVVDEMSMCGLQLFATMLGGIKSGSILLLVGDEDQLQSVEYGNILHDLINSGVIEVYRLREALRQSGTICTSAGKINQGMQPLKKGKNIYFSLKIKKKSQMHIPIIGRNYHLIETNSLEMSLRH